MRIDHARYLIDPRPSIWIQREDYQFVDFDSCIDAPELIPKGSTSTVAALGFGVRHEPDFLVRTSMQPSLDRWNAQETMLRDAMRGQPEAEYI